MLCCICNRLCCILQHAVLRYTAALSSLQMYTTEIAELFDVLYTKNLSKVRPH